MPELTEVEAARLAIVEHCVGKKIMKSLVVNDSKVIDGVSPRDLEAELIGKTIVAAHRKGKNMWLQLDSPPSSLEGQKLYISRDLLLLNISGGDCCKGLRMLGEGQHDTVSFTIEKVNYV